MTLVLRAGEAAQKLKRGTEMSPGGSERQLKGALTKSAAAQNLLRRGTVAPGAKQRGAAGDAKESKRKAKEKKNVVDVSAA